MKVCILSMQKVPNFGSLLQSYSLKKLLEELGHTVSFIDIEPNDADNRLIEKRQFFNDEEEGGKTQNVFLSKIKKIDLYTINRIRIKIKSNKQLMMFQTFREKVLDIKEEDNQKQYDVCVIGSDEVFNCLSLSDWGFTSQLFGNVWQASKVITYAASCGFTTYDNLSLSVKQRILESFENISAFSVRDRNTEEFVSNFITGKPEIHFDPVVIGDFQKEMLQNENFINMPDKYCILYSYYNRFHKKEEIVEVENFCKKNKLKLITIGSPQYWIKDYCVLNPFEVLVAFSGAEFIITDTFHGTIFSAKYAKRFAVMLRPSNKNKLGDLIIRLGLENHVVNKLDELEKVYYRYNDFQNITKIQKEGKKKAIEFFNQNL